MFRRLLVLVAIAAWLGWSGTAVQAANNCAGGGGPRPDDSGVGGTGLRPSLPGTDDSGVGGTGARPGAPEEDDSGVGGTGVTAHGDTGVIGTITGFASICVGGVEIHYDTRSSVQIDGAPASAAQLAVGQVVEVVASGTGSELRASDIAVHHLVSGPIVAIDTAQNAVNVIGQTVQLSSTTRVDLNGDESAAVTQLVPGTAVQVSGMRREDGVIVASRISRADAGAALLSGPIAGAPGALAVAGTPLELANGAAVGAGDEVRVVGHWTGDRLVASTVEPIPQLPFRGRVDRIDVEGYAAAAPGGALRVGPFVFEVPGALSADALARVEGRERIRIQAVVQNRRAVVEQIGHPPELPPRPEGRDGGPHLGFDPAGSDDARNGHVPPPGRDGMGSMPPRPPDGREMGAPGRPDRPGPPVPPQLPDRPPRVDRPPSVRGVIPDRPPRPERPPLPQRF